MSEAKASEPSLSERPLRVLVVEDVPADAELVVRVLKRGGYPLEFDLIDSAPDFEKRLAESDYDAIVCDHNLRTWRGMEGLEILKKSGKDIPFLVVTGVLGDEAAVEYLKCGATDYLLKDRLERLPAALSRALSEKAEREEAARLQEQIACARREWEVTFNSVPDPIMLVNEECEIRRANRALAELVGLELSQIIGKHCYEVLHRLDKPREDCPHHCLLKTGTEARGDLEEPRLGKIFDVTTSPLRDSSGALKGSVSVLRDITERRRVEEALRESEEQFRGFIENLPLGVYRITPPGRVLMANPALLRMLGYDSGQDLAFRNLEGESSRTGASRSALLKQIGRGGEVKGHEAAWKRRDESVVFVRESTRAFQAEDGKVLYYDGAVEDISERKRLEEQLHQAQRMEAVGSLASGVAHDFNNLLTIIIGYSDLLLDGIGADVRMLPYAEGIKTAAERAAALTRQLLAFTRKHAVSPRILDLNPVLTNVDKMLRRMLGDNIELVTHLPPGLGCVKADPGRIEQVIINLAVSARDAMPQGGRLTLEAANVELDSSFGGKYESVRPGHYVMIAVSDTGIGMETETQAHLFQPFSAAQDREIGLGLAAVYGIVRQSEGHLWVYSEPGKGTTFKVYLPRVDQAPEGVVAVGESVDEPALNSETVLLIENDEAMRSLTKGILESRGYGVLEAKGPNEALEVAERHRKPIHLLLTDVVMPQISGVELTKHLTLFHPETKVLYMSGYADKVILHHGVTDPDRAFLQKPFTAEALARKLRQVLGSVEAKKA